MDNLNYVIKTYEAVLVPTEDNKGKVWLRNCVWVIIGIIIIGSFVLDINIFEEISWSVRIFLIILAIGFGFYGEKRGFRCQPYGVYYWWFSGVISGCDAEGGFCTQLFQDDLSAPDDACGAFGTDLSF